jgi:hypothetical protein
MECERCETETETDMRGDREEKFHSLRVGGGGGGGGGMGTATAAETAVLSAGRNVSSELTNVGGVSLNTFPEREREGGEKNSVA